MLAGHEYLSLLYPVQYPRDSTKMHVVCATAATSLAVLCERECSMSSWKSLLIRFDLFSVTMDEASLGSLRHLVRTLVPRDDSSIQYCCMIEMLHTSTEANDTNISLLISSPLLELDNKWQRKFSLRISTLVDIDGHWRASLTVFPEKCLGSWRILRPILI